MDYPATFVATLLHSATNAHFMHLQTDSYAKHKALQKYYESIVDLADTYAEVYQGCYEVIKSYPAEFVLAKDSLKFMTAMKDFVEDIRSELPKDTQLQNIVDEICSLIDATLYKLKTFK